MFDDLPVPLKEKVLEYLEDNNFPAAKALYDEYHTARTLDPKAPLNKKPTLPKETQEASRT